MKKLNEKLMEYGFALENTEKFKPIHLKIKKQEGWKKSLGNYLYQELSLNQIRVVDKDIFCEKFNIPKEYKRINRDIFEKITIQIYPEIEQMHLITDYLQNYMDEIMEEYKPEQMDLYTGNDRSLELKLMFDENGALEELKEQIEDELWEFADELEAVNRTEMAKKLFNETLEAIIE